MPSITISQVYQNYLIMPVLDLHQRRVASVAVTIFEQLPEDLQISLDKATVITAGLLHDMGNIIKSDLRTFPEFVPPHELGFWEEVKTSFLDTYGSDEHSATLAITQELGQDSNVVSLIDSIGFFKVLELQTAPETALAEKIINYADRRVTPWGITSLEDRHKDLITRYASTQSDALTQAVQSSHITIKKIEAQLESLTQTKLSLLTESQLSDTIDHLKNWKITVPDNWHPPFEDLEVQRASLRTSS